MIIGRAVDHRVAAQIGRIGLRRIDAAHVQEREVRGVDVAFQRLQPVALALHHERLHSSGGSMTASKHGRGGACSRLAHVGPDEPVALERRVGLRPDLLGEGLGGRDVRHVEAIALHVELPAVIRAAQPGLLVAAEEQGRAAMRAAVIHDADASARVAERDQLLAQQHEAGRWSSPRQARTTGRRGPSIRA